MLRYFTVVIPFAKGCPTEWHPTEETGPFSTLTRGAFPSEIKARAWAKERKIGTYSVKQIEGGLV